MLHIKQTNVRRLKGGEQTDWPGLCSPSFPLVSYIPNWVQESLVSQKYQCVQKEKALTSLLSQLKDQERAASQDRQHKKVSALLQQTTQKTLWPHVHHAAKANERSLLPGCNEVPQTLQDDVREGGEQGLNKAPHLPVPSVDTMWGAWDSSSRSNEAPSLLAGTLSQEA